MRIKEHVFTMSISKYLKMLLSSDCVLLGQDWGEKIWHLGDASFVLISVYVLPKWGPFGLLLFVDLGGGGFPLLFFCCIHVVFTIQPVWTVPGHYWEEKIGGVDYFGKGHEVYLTNVLFWPIALPCMFLSCDWRVYTRYKGTSLR